MQIDPEDAPLFEAFPWKVSAAGYLAVKKDGRTALFHREILRAPKGLQVDHVNGDKLDNRKENLRLVDQSQNQTNTPKRAHKSGFTHSRYKGVSKAKSGWVARHGKNYLGWYTTEVAAARAYNRAVIEKFGPRMFLNDVPND